MSANINWLITEKNITVNYNGQTHIISRNDVLANKLIDAIKNNKADLIPELVSTSKRVEKFGNGNFKVVDGRIFINGFAAPKVLSDKIIKFSNEGLPCEPLIKFAENLQKNPSFRAVNELYQFLEKNDHPITQNGNFIAYKKVRSDFLDAYTATIDNSVGNTVSMPRNEVNEDPNVTCSNGLHVANWSYANNVYYNNVNSKMLEVEVNPSDVVSVPVDYNNSKIRVCSYKVLGVVDCENSSAPLRVTDEYESEQDEEEKEELEEEEEEEEECLDNYYCCSTCNDEEDFYPWDDELK